MSDRKLIRYALYQLDPAWRALPAGEREVQRKEVSDVMDGVEHLYTYSTVGLREDADLCTWHIADGHESVQALQTALNGTVLGGRYLRVTHSYLAMTRPSAYLGGHKHASQEGARGPYPVGATYLFLYPMDKQRAWYRLPFDERRRIMGEHFKIGHRYPGVTIHTGYSFGIDDQEFVVAFEGESPAEFLDLVQELRESESSAYTLRDTPIFTCVRMPIADILRQLDPS